MDKLLTLVSLTLFSLSVPATENCSRSLEVTATAYTSTVDETNNNPTIAAWGDELKPGMNVIAVSRDLIEMGLDHGTVVSIEGLDKEQHRIFGNNRTSGKRESLSSSRVEPIWL